MDRGEYRLGGKRVYAFAGVLGYSRQLYLEYVDSTRSEVLVACHRRMFAAFDGVPREVLYDNMKTVVTQRDAYGRGRRRFHDTIWMLAAELGYRPRLCRPYRPQTKGKVERVIHYIAHNFFHPLVTGLALEDRVPGLDELNAEATHWCNAVANVRIHGTTGERPVDRLGAELSLTAVANHYATLADEAAKEKRSYIDFLEQVLGEEAALPAERGYKVRFITTADLVLQLEKARREARFDQYLRRAILARGCSSSTRSATCR
ncbi:DDE-type integrase/transposase/recombinase [Ectothiorhodospiraceae bacterium WFHF3C12]|nr:DDE-type integrase/transposase/recombinase [Ectothiorhodospiraceae bacterium WFHF3C12]